MLWKDFYKGLVICTGDEDPRSEEDFFDRLLRKDSFLLRPVLDFGEDEDGRFVRPIRFHDMRISVLVNSIKVENEPDVWIIDLRTTGVLPPGIMHGGYKLKFRHLLCDSLPSGAMIEYGKVPAEEIARQEESVQEEEQEEGFHVAPARLGNIRLLEYKNRAVAVIPPGEHKVSLPPEKYDCIILLSGALRVNEVRLKVPGGGECQTRIGEHNSCSLPDDTVTLFSFYDDPSVIELVGPFKRS